MNKVLLGGLLGAFIGALAGFSTPPRVSPPVAVQGCLNARYDVDEAYRESTLARCRAQGTPINDL